jgi:GNAT superfamily N-acetyltransferase
MAIAYRNDDLGKSACFQLFAATGWNRVYGLNEAEYFEAVLQSWHVVAAFDGEQLVGLGRIISDGRLYALIVDIIVLPQYRRRGIGTAIMQQLLERCRTSGIRDVKLFAVQGKADFYRNFGFVARPAEAPGMGLPLRDRSS